MNRPDKLQDTWDRIGETVEVLEKPLQKKSSVKTPDAKERLFFELWRIEHLTQRQIAARYNTSQSTVFRACQRVEQWLGTASQEELGELPCEQRYRAAVRIHERKLRSAQGKLLRDYERSGQPQTTKQTRVRKEADKSKGELERWEIETKRDKGRDPKYLKEFVKMSNDEMKLAGESAKHDDAAQEHLDRLEEIKTLLNDVRLLHQEYVERLSAHQRIYGYMDKHGLKRDSSPSLPLGGWVPREDLSARRDHPGVFTYDKDDNKITAESLYGPAEQWQPGTEAWFERKRKEAAEGKESGDRGQESGDRSQESGDRSQESGDRGQESGDRGQESGDRGQESGDRGKETAAACQAESSESSCGGESGQKCHNRRENRCESPPRESRECESKSESSGTGGAIEADQSQLAEDRGRPHTSSGEFG